MLVAWGVALLSFSIAAMVTHRLSQPGVLISMVDHPNHRSLHSQPKPRTGGLGILSGLAVGLLAGAVLVGFPRLLAGILAGAALVAGVSLRDDYRPVGPGVRLLVHLLAAAVGIVAAGLVPERLALPYGDLALNRGVTTVLAILFLTWMVNLYNFMDGMDGFAGGMAVIGFGTYALLGWVQGAPGFALASALASAAAAGFLVFNFPPSRIFMGDVGSCTLGFMAGAFALWADRTGVFPLWVGILVFSPFVVDATATLLRRMLRGSRLWEPHRTHLYQRLVQSGWGHRRTVLVEYAVMLACGVSALWAVRLSPRGQVAVAAAWVLLYGIGILAVRLLVSRSYSPGGRSEEAGHAVGAGGS